MIVWEEQVMNKENKEIIKQEEASTQEKKKSRKELYKEFGKKIDEKWKEASGIQKIESPSRKKATIIYTIIIVAILVAILISFILEEILIELILCIILLAGVVIVYYIDRKKYALEYEAIDENKMKCAGETICDILGGGDVGIQKKLLFIDEFESISQKTIPYLILKYFSSIVSLFCSFFAFAVGVYAGSTHLTETLAGLIIVFAVGALFNSDFFKRILLTDRYYQRIVKQYRQYLVDDYLELTKKNKTP